MYKSTIVSYNTYIAKYNNIPIINFETKNRNHRIEDIFLRMF